jgi:hypothetical protein
MYGFAQVVVSGPMHTHEYAWLGAITANGDGTYTGAYNTTMCGYYALRVEMGPTEGVAGSGVPLPTDDNGDWYNVFNSGNYDKYMAKGSPYKAYVNPGATVASMSYAYDAPDLLDNNDLQVSIDPISKSEWMGFGCVQHESSPVVHETSWVGISLHDPYPTSRTGSGTHT